MAKGGVAVVMEDDAFCPTGKNLFHSSRIVKEGQPTADPTMFRKDDPTDNASRWKVLTQLENCTVFTLIIIITYAESGREVQGDRVYGVVEGMSVRIIVDNHWRLPKGPKTRNASILRISSIVRHFSRGLGGKR
jgi:hypothetical protein